MSTTKYSTAIIKCSEPDLPKHVLLVVAVRTRCHTSYSTKTRLQVLMGIFLSFKAGDKKRVQVAMDGNMLIGQIVFKLVIERQAVRGGWRITKQEYSLTSSLGFLVLWIIHVTSHVTTMAI